VIASTHSKDAIYSIDVDSWEELESKDLHRYEEGINLLEKGGIAPDPPPKGYYENCKDNVYALGDGSRVNQSLFHGTGS
jgi:hypothetical protein